MLKKILIGLVAVIAILCAVIATRPAEYTVTRSATFAAPQGVAFAQVVDFHKWEAWSPWAKLDPSMKTTYEGAESGMGAVYKWTGNDDVGQGMMTVTAAQPSERIDIDLRFIQPFESKADTLFTFAPEGQGTKVTWSMKGHNNFMSKAFGLVMNMDKMIGADFEKGLAAMKTVSEAEAIKRAEEAAAKLKVEAEAAAAKAAADAAMAAEAAAAEAAAKSKGKRKGS